MKNKTYYEKLFETYPDVLNLKQFRSLLCGMNEKMALKIVKDNLVNHFIIGRTIYIPKVYAIDYVMSAHYDEFTKRRKRYGKQGSDPISKK